MILGMKLFFCLDAVITSSVNTVEISKIEGAYYVSQILSAVVLVVTLVLAIVQYFSHKDEYKENHKFNVELHEHRKREKALELTGFYKNNILGHTLMFSRVYDKIGIRQKLEQIRKSDMKDFDEYELENNILSQDISWIKERPKSDDFFVALLEHQHIHGEEGFAAGIQKEDLSRPEIRDKLETGYRDVHMRLLNNLEFFAMHFMNDVANEEIVYRSLHKTYIDIVELFCFDICLNNVKDGSKLYTNVIALYNKWKERATDERSVREDAYRRCNSFSKRD